MKTRFFFVRVTRYPGGSFVINRIETNHGEIAAWYDRDGTLTAAEFRPSETPVKRNSPAWQAIAPLGRKYASA